MSNMSVLIANDIPGPAGGMVGRNRKGRESIALGPLAVPIYWLSLFDSTHLVTFEEKDEDGMILTIPSLLADIDDGRRLLWERSQILSEWFPEFQPTWRRFARRIDRLKSRYIKVDVLELWDLAAAVEQDFESDLRRGVRWFESQDSDDFERLLGLANINSYDPETRTFQSVGEDVPRAFHLRGYAYTNSAWDDKADT